MRAAGEPQKNHGAGVRDRRAEFVRLGMKRAANLEAKDFRASTDLLELNHRQA